MDVAQSKKALRKEALLKRLALSRTEFWELNDGIYEQLIKLNWQQYQSVHLFLPVREKNEADTFELINFLKTQYPKINIIVPRMLLHDSGSHLEVAEMQHLIFDPEHTVLRKNKYNIPEPVYGKNFPVNSIDAVVVPLVAFDKNGHRLGYGGGYYDRFLAQCNPAIAKVGISFFNPIEEIPVHQYDVKLTHCVTPHQTYQF